MVSVHTHDQISIYDNNNNNNNIPSVVCTGQNRWPPTHLAHAGNPEYLVKRHGSRRRCESFGKDVQQTRAGWADGIGSAVRAMR